MEYLLCCFLQGEWTASYHEGDEKTSEDVAEEDEKKGTQFSLANESCGACVEFKTVVYYCCKSEGEEYGSDNALFGEVVESCDADADAGKDG